MTALGYDASTGEMTAIETVSTLPESYPNMEHGSGKALNAAGGPASGPNSSGTMKGPAGSTPDREHWDQVGRTTENLRARTEPLLSGALD